tara:strand:+ start:252 stop:470 length:219 start_codon:yes stop_codon:yes gene_type:complete
MSNQETVKFTIKQDGTVSEEVMNVAGQQCLEVTKHVEEKLGDVVSMIHTADFYSELDFQGVVEEFTHDSEGC